VTRSFADQAVVLTGASSGIGREMALQLAEEGARLLLAARRQELLEEVAAACRHRGGTAHVQVCDVTQEDECRALVERAVAELGGIDTLLLNAGRTLWSLFADFKTMRPLEEVMQVNYFGSVYCTHYALPHLLESRGRLVAVASLTGKTGVPTRSGYAASKHAMVGFFDTLRIELHGTGVSVTVACPDFVATETRERAFGADGEPVGKSPVKEDKVMSAEECARRILAGAAKRRRELIMSPRGKVGLYLKMFAPGWVDAIARRAIARGR